VSTALSRGAHRHKAAGDDRFQAQFPGPIDDFRCVGPGIQPDLGDLFFRNLTDHVERLGRWHVNRDHIDPTRDIEDRMVGREALDLCLVSVNRNDFVASATEGAHGLIAELLGIGRRPDDGYAFHSGKYSAWASCLLSCTVSH